MTGTEGYQAPEVRDEEACDLAYNEKTDIFALGMAFFYLTNEHKVIAAVQYSAAQRIRAYSSDFSTSILEK